MPNTQTISKIAPAIKYQSKRDCYYFDANHYLIMFSPAGFEEYLKATSVPAPINAVAPTEPPAVADRNVLEPAADYGIQFGN